METEPNPKPRRTIFVGLKGYVDIAKKISQRGSDIYAELTRPDESTVTTITLDSEEEYRIRETATHTGLFSYSTRLDPMKYIQDIARLNDCEINHSPAIDKGLMAVGRLETISKQIKSIVG